MQHPWLTAILKGEILHWKTLLLDKIVIHKKNNSSNDFGWLWKSCQRCSIEPKTRAKQKQSFLFFTKGHNCRKSSSFVNKDWLRLVKQGPGMTPFFPCHMENAKASTFKQSAKEHVVQWQLWQAWRICKMCPNLAWRSGESDAIIYQLVICWWIAPLTMIQLISLIWQRQQLLMNQSVVNWVTLCHCFQETKIEMHHSSNTKREDFWCIYCWNGRLSGSQ